MTQAEPPVPASWAPTKAEVCKARAMICNTMAVLGAHLEVGSPEYCDILRQRTACVNDHLVTMLFFWEGLLGALFGIIAVGRPGAWKTASWTGALAE